LIINADDFGYSQSVNRAIADCFKNGYINRATIMVNMPYAQEAADIARQNGFFDSVGLHINLTEGKALSEECAKSELCDENGYLKGVFHVPIKSRLYLKSAVRKAIYAETKAQIEKYISMGFTLMHADSHNYPHVYISVFGVIKKLLRDYGFKSVRISRNIPENDFSLPFKIYKDFFNFYIKRFKVNKKRIQTTGYFGSVQDFESLDNKQKYKNSVELMTHPDYIDGVLTDNTLPSPHPFKDKIWQEENKLHLEDVSGKKKKILVCFIQAHIGGAMTSLINFLNSLDTSKYDVDVMFYENENKDYGIKNTVNILPQGKTHRSSDVKNLIAKMLSPSYMCAKLKEIYFKKIAHNKRRAVQIMSKQGSRYSAGITGEYDVAVAFEMSWALNYVINRVCAKKKILWFHNDFESAGYSYSTDKTAFKKADALVFVSEECRLKFSKCHPEMADKSYFIPNLLSADFVRQRANEEITLPFEDTDRLKFLSVSRVNFDEKGLDRAARVFKRLKDENLLSDTVWTVVGKGRDSEAFAQLIKEYGLEDVIFPIGLKTNPVPYMKNSDILFLPSIHEGMPMVVTEGFMMGLVPVVTEYTSANEQIRNGIDGLVFENSEEGLYNGLKKLLSDTSILETLKNNIRNSEYGNEKKIAEFEKLLERL
ncbi:MAG: ChbG/HpnK family deacetylase, partial [Clostridia bacterium]|nr:ChbG/HpnK family deacetylase [Clostridia bacterium]